MESRAAHRPNGPGPTAAPSRRRRRWPASARPGRTPPPTPSLCARSVPAAAGRWPGPTAAPPHLNHGERRHPMTTNAGHWARPAPVTGHHARPCVNPGAAPARDVDVSQFLGIPVVGYSFGGAGGTGVKVSPVCGLVPARSGRVFSDVRGAGDKHRIVQWGRDVRQLPGSRRVRVLAAAGAAVVSTCRCCVASPALANTGGSARPVRGGNSRRRRSLVPRRRRRPRTTRRPVPQTTADPTPTPLAAGGAAGTGGSDAGLDGVSGRLPMRHGRGATGLRPSRRARRSRCR